LKQIILFRFWINSKIGPIGNWGELDENAIKQCLLDYQTNIFFAVVMLLIQEN
jgi:hypothetical protein